MNCPKPCTYNSRPMSFAAREAGCPLDHCACGTHDALNEDHKCIIVDDEPEVDGYYGGE